MLEQGERKRGFVLRVSPCSGSGGRLEMLAWVESSGRRAVSVEE